MPIPTREARLAPWLRESYGYDIALALVSAGVTIWKGFKSPPENASKEWPIIIGAFLVAVELEPHEAHGSPAVQPSTSSRSGRNELGSIVGFPSMLSATPSRQGTS